MYSLVMIILFVKDFKYTVFLLHAALCTESLKLKGKDGLVSFGTESLKVKGKDFLFYNCRMT